MIVIFSTCAINIPWELGCLGSQHWLLLKCVSSELCSNGLTEAHFWSSQGCNSSKEISRSSHLSLAGYAHQRIPRSELGHCQIAWTHGRYIFLKFPSARWSPLDHKSFAWSERFHRRHQGSLGQWPVQCCYSHWPRQRLTKRYHSWSTGECLGISRKRSSRGC